jgi:ABC-2 type transport system ATP-binding protein
MATAIKVNEIRKVYRTSSKEPLRAVDGVSFEVPQGQIFGLLGPNGAGKTTLVKILSTMTTPTSGQASVHDFDVCRQPLEVRKRIAVVLQQTAVETLLTVEDNLRVYAYMHGLGTKETAMRMGDAMEEFELRGIARQTLQDLSLGTKRRVQVAKVFMVNSSVIFLDECTTGMDPLMKRRVLDRVRLGAKNGQTVLLTTHVLSEAEELCDRIMIVNNGTALASGSLEELRRLSRRMFHVNITFATGDADLGNRLRVLEPAELRVEGDRAEMLFKGEEAALLDRLAEVSRSVPFRHFEVRAADLEEIFVELVGGKPADAETGTNP